MGAGYFATTITASTPPSKPVTWLGRCRGVVIATEQRTWFEARERLIAEMGAMGFWADEVMVERAPGGGA